MHPRRFQGRHSGLRDASPCCFAPACTRGGSFLFDQSHPANGASPAPSLQVCPGQRFPSATACPLPSSRQDQRGGPRRAGSLASRPRASDRGDPRMSIGCATCTADVAGAGPRVHPRPQRAKTAVERQKLQREFDERVRAFRSSEQGRALARAERSYALVFESMACSRGRRSARHVPVDPGSD